MKCLWLLAVLLPVTNVFGRNLLKKLMDDFDESKLKKEIDGLLKDDVNKYFRNEPTEQEKRSDFIKFTENVDEETVNKINKYSGEEMKIEKSSKRGVPQYVQKWPKDANGQLHIPYVIDTNSYTAIGIQIITSFINEMNAVIRCNPNVWKPRTNETHFVKILNDGGCYSYLGKNNIYNPQNLSLGRGCIYKGITHHEMMHAMGFGHEQSRSDRDEYVQILTQNIKPNCIKNFKKEPITNNFNKPYDYRSIMHYGKRAFTINGHITIRTIDPTKQNLIGNRVAMTESDIFIINKFYECPDNPTDNTTKSSSVTTVAPGTNILNCTNYYTQSCRNHARGLNVRVIENGKFVEARRELGLGILIVFERTQTLRQKLGCQCTRSPCPQQSFCLRFNSRSTTDSSIIVIFRQGSIIRGGSIVTGDSHGVQSRAIDISGICSGFLVIFNLRKGSIDGQADIKDVTVAAGKCSKDTADELENNGSSARETYKKLEDQLINETAKVMEKMKKLEDELNHLTDELAENW